MLKPTIYFGEVLTSTRRLPGYLERTLDSGYEPTFFNTGRQENHRDHGGSCRRVADVKKHHTIRQQAHWFRKGHPESAESKLDDVKTSAKHDLW